MLYERFPKKTPPSALSRSERFKGLANEQLVALFQAGDERALAVLVEKNQGMVYSVVRRHLHKCTSMTSEDLANEGAFGLIRAARDYDPTVGANYCTYAMGWVRHHVGRAADEDSTLLSMGGRVKLAQIVPKYAREVERLVRDGVDYEGAHTAAKEALGMTDYVAEGVRGFHHAKNPRSLDAKLSVDDGQGDRTLYDIVAAEQPDAEKVDEDTLDRRALFDRIDEMRAHLNERELAILDGRLLDDSQTLADVADKFGLSRERVRQLEEKLRKKVKRVLTSTVPVVLTLDRVGVRAKYKRRKDAGVPRKPVVPVPAPPESERRLSARPRRPSELLDPRVEALTVERLVQEMKKKRGRPKKTRMPRCPALGGGGGPCGAVVREGDLCTLHTMRWARGISVEVAAE